MTDTKPRETELNRFSVLNERIETRTCSTCGADFEVTVLTLRFNELGGTATECEACTDAAEERMREAKIAAGKVARLAQSGLPRALRDCRLQSDRHPRALEAAQRWAGDRRAGGLCLLGPPGVGKTYLAAAACLKRLERYGIDWISLPALMAKLRTGFGDEERSEAQELINRPTAVVLDDLDKVNPTDYGLEVILALVDGRITAEAPLMVTTNLTLSELGDKLSWPIVSRLAGYCEVFELEGADRRLERA